MKNKWYVNNPWGKGGKYYPQEITNEGEFISNFYNTNETLNADRVSCNNALGTKDTKLVQSFKLNAEIYNAGSLWKFVKLKFKDREKILKQLINMQGLPQNEIDILNYLKTGKSDFSTGLWDYLRANIQNNDFDIKLYINNDFLNYNRNYEAAIEDEVFELSKLKNKRYDSLKKVIMGKDQFHDNYLKFVLKIIKIKEEQETEKDRLDNIFNNFDLKNILNKFKDFTFYSSELKAIIFQESGDLTNLNIEGIINNGRGFKEKGNINTKYVGIAQIGNNAMIEGIRWANKNGIKIEGDDPRRYPESSIILSACILVNNYENYLSKCYIDKSNCIEWKKLIIASYNWSAPKMSNLIRKFNSIDWLFLTSKNEIPKETINYVSNIIKRLQ